MDYYESIERAVAFIEKNLTEPISVADVSRHAFQSRWHFQRIFRSTTGTSVYTYIKKRRLAEAGSELFLTNDKIIDIALKYQYSTPESFLRAFRAEYGANPSDYRKGSEHRLYDRLDVASLRTRGNYAGGIRFQPVTRSEILFAGKPHRTTMQRRQNEIDIPRFWKEFTESGELSRLDAATRAGTAAMGVYTNWDYDENFDVLIGAPVRTRESVPDGWVLHRLMPARYMVFTIPGNSNQDILNGWNYIYGTWMPETGYERDFSDDFDMFDDRFWSDRPESEIYIPIK